MGEAGSLRDSLLPDKNHQRWKSKPLVTYITHHVVCRSRAEAPSCRLRYLGVDRLSLRHLDPLRSLHRPALKQTSLIGMIPYMNWNYSIIMLDHHLRVKWFPKGIFPHEDMFPSKNNGQLWLSAETHQNKWRRGETMKVFINVEAPGQWTMWEHTESSGDIAYVTVLRSKFVSRIPERHARATALL